VLWREELTAEIGAGDAGESAAHSIGGAASTRRGNLAPEQSASSVVSGSKATSETAQTVCSRAGHEQEFSGGVGTDRGAATGMSVQLAGRRTRVLGWPQQRVQLDSVAGQRATRGGCAGMRRTVRDRAGTGAGATA
jgi:hypothetical protein